MGNLPSGIVTFLFTDIEGSTKLAQEHSNEMPALLARHNEILNQAIQRHNGYVFQIVGDSFSAAFQNVRDAVNAALDAQNALHKETWSPAPIKVRMGIHTGAARLTIDSTDSKYDGYATLAQSQRIMSAGHGGQILLSQTTHDLLASNIPNDTKLSDMGEHNLKDIVQIQRIYQVNTPDLPSEFPPLKTQKVKNHNLPVKLTTFIGRERELIEAKKWLNEARLLTLIGPGGTGKTRLSIQLGGDQLALYPDGVWMIELAPLANPALITQTIASVFGLRDSPDRPLIEQITDYLRAKSALIILDNCEHLIDACARIAESLIQACANLKILASSREALGVSGETTYRIPSLSLPSDFRSLGDFGSLLDYEAIRLFVDRASAANPKFKLTKDNASSVAQICRRLDGIPLALELAAARARVLSVEQIAERLDDRFRLLTGGARTALPRQQTLRALIDWSYDLLSDPEKALFRRLAVFVGGWTLEAAESVCSGGGVEFYEVLDLLTQLVDKSLVIAEEQDGAVRYHRLETIRQYARDKLFETNEVSDVRNRHLEYYIQFGAAAETEYINPYQHEMVKKMTPEYDNIRSALIWGIDNQLEKAAELLSLSIVIWPWVLLGNTSEARDWLLLVLERINTVDAGNINNLAKLKGRLLNRYSQVTMNMGDHQVSCAAAEESMAIARETNDEANLADALGSLGHCAAYAGDLEKATKAAKEGIQLSKRLDAKRELIWGLDAMTHIHHLDGNDKELFGYFTEINETVERMGSSLDPVYAGGFKVEQAIKTGNLEEAEKQMEIAIGHVLERQDSYMLATFQSMFAHALRGLGDLDKASMYYRKTIRLWQDRGHRAAIAHQLECFGFISLAKEHFARAAKLLSAAQTLRDAVSSVRTPEEQKEFEAATTSLQSKTYDFDKIWEEGNSMTIEQAIEYALEETSE